MLYKNFLIILVVAVTTLGSLIQVFNQSVHADITTGLVGYWKFDEGSGTTTADSFGSNSSATLTNGASWTTGRSGTGINFDGIDDYVNAGSAASIDNLTHFTYSAWIYPRTPGENYEGRIIEKAGGLGFKKLSSSDVIGNNFRAEVETTGSTAIVNSNANTLSLNTWQYVTLVYDDSTKTATIYKNGAVIASNTGAGNILADDSGNLLIGNNANTDRTFNGVIDEVRVYSRALTATEVTDLYNNSTVIPPTPTSTPTPTPTPTTSPTPTPTPTTSPTPTPGPGGPAIAAYHFNEGFGTQAADSSGNNTGILQQFGCTTLDCNVSSGWTATGKNSGGLRFDETNDNVSAGSAPVLDDMLAISVSAWIYTPANTMEPIVFKANTDDPIYIPVGGWGFFVKDNNSALDRSLQFQVDYSGVDLYRTSFNSVFAANTWTHVAATWDGTLNSTGIRIYVNGVEVNGYQDSSNGSGTRVSDASNNLAIGSSQNFTGCCPSGPSIFNGTLDDVRIYNRVLSTAEIQTDMNTPVPTGTLPTSTPTPTTSDTTAPTVLISSPASGTTVSGTITVSATASDNVGVAGVQFKLDGANFGAEDTTSPYSMSWDTTTATNASHTLTAVARDAAGNTTTSGSISVTVSNIGPTPIPTPTPLPAGTILLEDFASMRINGDGGNLWFAYLGEGDIQTLTLENGQLKIVTGAPNSGVYHDFFPRSGGYSFPQGYAQSWIKSGTWDPDVNRLRFNAKCNVNVTRNSGGSDNLQIGTYTRPKNTVDSAWQGAHYYHLLDLNWYANRWVQIELNRVPQHQVGSDPNINWPENPSAPGVNYFDGLTLFYFDTQNGSPILSNATCFFDDYTFAKEIGEPDSFISSMAYLYSGTRYEVTWAAPKNSVTTYNVRYHTSSMKGSTFGALGTNGGTVQSPGSAYTGDFWASPNMAESSTGLYVAIQPQGQTAFTEVYIPNFAASTPTPTTSDTTAPTVLISSPASGTTVSGTITVSATASDNVGVAGVQFKLDGSNLGIEDTSSPYSVSWNTTSLTKNSSHTLTATAHDAAGNITTSTVITVAINNGPIISNIQTANITDTSAVISWTTDTPSTSKVNYGLTSSYTVSTVKDNTLVTNHSIIIGNLTGSTLYHYQVESTDSLTSLSSDQTFTTTAPATLPLISNIQSSNITQTGATITWTTDKLSDSQIEYGLTTSYGSSTALDSSQVTNHSVTLTGLSAGTSYSYRVKSSGSVSTNLTFTTSPPTSIDTIAPAAVANLTVTSTTRTSAELSWTAPGDDGNTGTAAIYQMRWFILPITESNWNNAFILTGLPPPAVAGTVESYTAIALTPNTTYYFALKTTDESGNTSLISNIASGKTKRTPNSIKNLKVTASDKSVSLTWSPPDIYDADIKYAILRSTVSGTIGYLLTNQTQIYDNSSLTYTETNLVNDTAYYYSVFSYYDLGAYSGGVFVPATPTLTVVPVTTTTSSGGGGGGGGYFDAPPGPVKIGRVVEADKQVLLEWTNPADLDFSRTILIQRLDALTDSTGSVIFEGRATAHTVANLLNDKTYYFAIYALDLGGNRSQPVIIKAVPKVGVVSFQEKAVPKEIAGVEKYVPTTPPSTTGSGNISAAAAAHFQGLVIRYAADGTVYLIDKNQKRLISDRATLLKLTGNNPNQVIDVPVKSYLETFQAGPPVLLKDAKPIQPTLVKTSDSPNIYLIDRDNLTKTHIPSLAVFYSYGLSFKNVTPIDSKILGTYQDEAPLPFQSLPDGTLVKLSNSPKVYIIQNGQKRWVKTFNIFKSYNLSFSNVIVQPKELTDSYQTAPDLDKTGETLTGNILSAPAVPPPPPAKTYPDGTLFQSSGPTVYYIEASQKRPFASVAVFELLGYKRVNIKKISDKELNLVINGSPIYNIAKHPNGTLVKLKDDIKIYLIENNKLMLLTLEEFQSKGYQFTQVVTISQGELGRY